MNNNHNAKYAFYYLLSLVALIFMTISIGMIGFEIVNQLVKDALSGASGSSDSALKFAISALFIAAPVFYVMSALINKGLKKGELDKNSPVRRWLTYFIILVSSVIILGVFIGVINNFLSGELSGRFIYKAIIMLLLAGGVFSYYFYDVKRSQVETTGLVLKIFFWASVGITAAVFISAWFFVESPQVARAKRLDQLVVTNIQNIESAVNSYYVKNGALPNNLNQIEADAELYLDPGVLSDPETGAPIGYNKTGAESFQLCAYFRTNNKTDNGEAIDYSAPQKRHLAGYQCLAGDLWSKDSVNTGSVNAKPVQAVPANLN
jgi:hypothetical protein